MTDSSPPAGPLPRILIVDDQPQIRRLLSVSLGRQHEVIEAVDGVTALAMMRAHAPRVVLLDVMMPGELNGLQVLDAIKANPHTRAIKVALLTARGQVTDVEDARRRGADAYFTKPFSPMQVLGWVRDVLGGDVIGSSGAHRVT